MKTARLGDLVEITIGRTPSRSDDSLWDKDKSTSNVWLSIADMPTSGNRRISNSKEYISDAAARSFAIVPKGTLLVSFKLTLGRLAYADIDLRTNEAIAALRNNEKAVLNDYLYHYLSYFDWSGYASADQKVKGFTLNKAKLAEIRVVYPESFEDQRSIITRLDAAFDKIAQAEILMKQNIENVSFLQKSILAKYLDAANDTHTHRLGDIFDVRDGTHDSPKYHSTGFPLVTSKNLKDGRLTMDNVKLINEIDYKKINERSKVGVGDVLMAMIGTIGNPIVIEKEPDFAVKNVALFKANKEQDSRFLRYYLDSDFAVSKMQKEANGTTQRFVSLGYLRNFPYPDVSLVEQQKIVSKLDELFGKVSNLQKQYTSKLAKLTNLRQSLLHEAFSS